MGESLIKDLEKESGPLGKDLLQVGCFDSFLSILIKLFIYYYLVKIYIYIYIY